MNSSMLAVSMLAVENTEATTIVNGELAVRVIIAVNDPLARALQKAMTIRAETPQNPPLSSLVILRGNIPNRLKS